MDIVNRCGPLRNKIAMERLIFLYHMHFVDVIALQHFQSDSISISKIKSLILCPIMKRTEMNKSAIFPVSKRGNSRNNKWNNRNTLILLVLKKYFNYHVENIRE